MECPHCKRENKPFLIFKDPHYGLYCDLCNQWIKWVDKEEIKLYSIKEEPKTKELF